MANWQHRLKLKDLRDRYEKGELTIHEEGKEVAKKIRELANNLLPVYANYKEDFLDLADQFEDTESVEEFDQVLSDLYDLGDTKLDTEWPGKKLCWIGFSL